MSEMVERCTDALLRAFFSRPIEEQHVSITAQDHYDLVRAVLQEVREPTQAMIEAPYRLRASADDFIHKSFYQAMIDEALA